jgi:hypothetical protein
MRVTDLVMVNVVSNKGIVKMPLSQLAGYVKAHEASQPKRNGKNNELRTRLAQHLDTFPCPARGESILEIKEKKGSCSCSDAPALSCKMASGGVCTPWPYSRKQSEPTCNSCEVRKLLIRNLEPNPNVPAKPDISHLADKSE